MPLSSLFGGPGEIPSAWLSQQPEEHTDMTMDDAQAPQRQELVAGKGAKGRMMTSWLGGGEQGPQGVGNAP